MVNDHAVHSIVLKSLMDNPQTKTAIDKALSTYPLYTGKKVYDLIPTREELNEKLLNHYKYREIGQETVGRFLDELKITMCEIMPRYNELFKTVETMADLPNPFDNSDIVETTEETRKIENKSEGESSSNGTSSTQTTGSSDSETKRSDTPQSSVSNIDSYLTDHSKTTGNSTAGTNGEDQSTTSSSGSSDSTETFSRTYTKKGNQGVNTYAHDMNEFRTSIIDVVEQIITDKRINDLFMLVW